MKIERKKLSSVMLATAISVAFVVLVANHLVLRQVRLEATRQAQTRLGSDLKLLWDQLHQKGREFRVRDGVLYVGEYAVNGNNEIPDRVLAITGSRSTIFMGDRRVATNVVHANGARALGTRLRGPAYDAIFRDGRPYRGSAPILDVPYFTAYDPIKNSSGEIIGALFVGVRESEYLAQYRRMNLQIVAINVTLAAVFVGVAGLMLWERRRFEQAMRRQLAFLQVLSDTIPSPVFVKDAHGRLTTFNTAFSSFVGRGRGELLGSPAHELWPADVLQRELEMEEALLEGRDIEQYESRLRCADGRERDVIFHVAALKDPDGTASGTVGVILDITERKAAEEEVRNAHYARVAAALLVQLGHDLKTPLTPLFALLPMVREALGDKRLKRMVEICLQSVRQIEGLAQKSLQLVRLSSRADQPPLAPVLLAAAAERARGELAASFAARGVACVNGIANTVRVAGASDQLELLFVNLLSNAARYAATNGTVLMWAVVREGEVQVSVQDDGIGLDAQHLGLIFQEFFKADAARHDLDTQGLGLAICQRIVVNHGGRIWAESAGLGKGTTVHFTLAPVAEGGGAGGCGGDGAAQEGEVYNI